MWESTCTRSPGAANGLLQPVPHLDSSILESDLAAVAGVKPNRQIWLVATIAATAATAVSPTPTAVSPAAPAAAVAASSAATLARTRFIDDDVAAHQVLAIERLHRASGLFIVGHFDETKTPKLSGGLVSNQCDGRCCNARLREPID